jgi:hypothetical protein
MDYPESVLEAVHDAAAEHGDDLEQATDCAVAKVRGLKEFPTLVDQFVKTAVQELLYRDRHQTNVAIRRQGGQYGAAAKVSPAGSAAVRRVFQSYFDYCVGGKQLGQVLGEELAGLAAGERERAGGHQFNARLLERLQTVVPEGKRVRDVVSNRKLGKLFEEVEAAAEAA